MTYGTCSTLISSLVNERSIDLRREAITNGFGVLFEESMWEQLPERDSIAHAAPAAARRRKFVNKTDLLYKVTCNLIACHTSHVTHHTSHVTRHTS